MTHDARRRTALADHIVAFGRMLRRAGLDVGSGQIIDALHAVEILGVARRDDVRQALFSIFVARRTEAELFDQAFDVFWQAPAELSDALTALLPKTKVPPDERPQQRRIEEALRAPEDERPSLKTRPSDREKEEVEVVMAYSAAEVLRRKDFATFTADEAARARAFLQRLQWPVPPQPVRRRTPRAKGRALDVRGTVRRSLRHHGEVLTLRRRGPKHKARPIIVLCDISGSMEPYTRMLLHFMHTVTGGLARVESFVFGTRLTRITRHLRRRDVDDALAALTKDVRDWGGGTRTGEALKAFNYDWLRRTLRSGGVVLVISDGCDRGDPALLAREMARLHRSAYRVLWLNPLLRYDGYEPLTRGMQAALPYIDDFLPVHNLASLEQLGRLLTDLAHRPARTWQQEYRWQVE